MVVTCDFAYIIELKIINKFKKKKNYKENKTLEEGFACKLAKIPLQLKEVYFPWVELLSNKLYSIQKPWVSFHSHGYCFKFLFMRKKKINYNLKINDYK